MHCFNQFANFVSHIVQQIEQYFVWPEWLILCEELFMFSQCQDLPLANRLNNNLQSLDKLFGLPCTHIPHTDNEKKILEQQYKSLFFKMEDMANALIQQHKGSKPLSMNQLNMKIWYNVLLNKTELMEIKQFAMRFLIRDANERSVESAIGDIEMINASRRSNLSYDHFHKQMFIRQNGIITERIIITYHAT